MFRYVLVVFMILSVGMTVFPAPIDDVSDALAHAEALYYEARFKESVELLLRIDDVLQPQRDRLQEKTTVKLQLALAFVGLNDNTQAKSRLRELYALNPDYRLDEQQFSPKVVTLSEEARSEQNDLRCVTISEDAHRQLAAGNTAALMNVLNSTKQKCSVLASLVPDAAELFYKKGIEAYKRGNFAEALEKFRTAKDLNPEHQLADQYIELTQNKLELASDRMILDWRAHFNAGEFDLASAGYRQLMSFNKAGHAAPGLDQIQTEYRKALSPLQESWNRACSINDTEAMEAARGQAKQMLPEPSIADDILKQMETCERKGCVPMTAQLAMVRLKTRVNPDIPNYMRASNRRTPVTVRVKIRIDEKGDVTVNDAQGGPTQLNDAVRLAVGRWKFVPAIVGNETRCVSTEIPMVINPDGTR